MTKTILLATTAILITAGAASAQTPGEQSAAPQAEANQQGVLVFTPDFFADQRPNTALDMVNRVPGFSVVDGDGSRGFEGSVGNVLVNGARPASKNDTGSAVLSRTLATQVERIELVRGGAPGIDMQGFAVVVNVITRSESSRQSILTLNGNLFDGGRDLFGGSYQFTAKDGDTTWGVTLSDGISMSDADGVGPVIRRDANGVILREEDYYNNQYGGGTAIRGNFATPFMGGKIDLTARYGVNDFNSINLQTAPDVLRENYFEDDGSSGEFGVVYTRPLSARLNLETRFIHQFNTFEGISTARTRVGGVDSPEQRFVGEGDASETILRGTVRFERSPALTFETGGEVAYNMLDTQQAFTVGGAPVALPSASVLVEELRGEVFGKSTWRMRPDLTLEAGLRLEGSTISQSGDADQEKSFFFAKPRFQATWTPRPNNQLRFRFERELGQLDFGDFAASADLSDENVLGGNVDLEPEQRWITELTYERRFWEDGIVSIGLRHDEIVDAIDVIPLDMGLSAVGNIGDGTLDQLAVNILAPMDKFGFTGGRLGFRNTWNHTEVTDPTSGDTRAISGVRPSQAVFTIAQDITSWKLQWGGAYIAKLSQTSYDPDQTSGFRGSDYFEFWTEYKPTPTLSLRAQINIWNDFEVERTIYADRSPARPVAFVENRYIDPRTFLSFRVRKTF
ncbi:MAG: TonB-dependent receptor [Alphaproteobacteria bacterium]|uniref:TonB-dependent receptor plug domain-containing protein n=1 Tax=Brevundimonas sp. TaxID=1871086 RepID=UPI0017B89CB2|nr:TonB-dependent receptor [Brevundimonas sp.]MBA3051469.1 TonB-dependent receptor [Brevundimonas sp.]MBU3972841.1 TonB-dependent receptor [Alphaproteobacteria bacterium]MBU4135966.1 TonB-dependent receptor [Alphaproteobacteria bacterium]